MTSPAVTVSPPPCLDVEEVVVAIAIEDHFAVARALMTMGFSAVPRAVR
jgi:hypothetical protein